MSSASTMPMDDTLSDGFESYRALSKAAVLSAALILPSLGALFFPSLAILPLLGAISGWNGYRLVRRYPAEYSGKMVGLIGSMLCGLLLVSSVSLHAFTYATECPEGHERISFTELQPVPEHPGMPVSPRALELNGKKVFIKGYVYPDGQQSNIKKFVLVPDMGTCCFGGQPKLTHMVEVTLADPHRIRYSYKQRKLAGVLTVDTALKPVSGVGGVYFQLQADHVQ